MRRCLMSVLAVLLFGFAPLSAQEAAAPGLTDDVAGIRRALDKLVVMLDIVQRNQRVDLLLKRIELRERRLAPAERRLANAQNDVENARDELRSMQAMRAQAEEEIDNAIRAGEADDEGARHMLGEIDRREAVIVVRQEEAATRVRRFEDDLADGREEIEILDEMLRELLGD